MGISRRQVGDWRQGRAGEPPIIGDEPQRGLLPGILTTGSILVKAANTAQISVQKALPR